MGSIKRIKVDPLDPASCEAAIKKLRTYEKQLETRKRELIRRLAQLAVNTAQAAFGEGVSVTAKKTRGQDAYMVEANGEQVVFLEFGTGALTNAHELGKNLTEIEISAGSWSRTEGTGTYDSWVASGKPLSEYPYNRFGVEGMYKAYKAILEQYALIAREVFK